MLFSSSLLLALAAGAIALPSSEPPSKRSPAFSFPTFSIPSFPGGGGSTGGFGGSGSSTANDVTNKAACKAITVIFARGTGESGNIGSVIGPPLLKALQAKVGAAKVAFQGVPYPASAAGNANGGGNGGALMTSLVQQALQQCPDTKVVISGYSQGGSVVHKAGPSLSATPPLPNGQAVANVPASKLKEYCAQGDGVCGTPRTFAITSAHLSYGNNAADAASFISSATGVTA
ncbi:cutinase [Physcia stellaris]|nr:cutinase [Physcia stellaris]